ncbi:sulfotransferase family 2 domain-containing protein [Pseudoalteromonas sp. MMG022]|uniref:sulfotransferase family 2 domain-containing protein n=1 Tax=Pseudoalteromonas sp. MMG022 TaxID=2909978 RepID=UPI001EEEA944|nr:sulfotransferase family 2 domain-containing protein [Pseudoalteromonas sp. MMG022]MCF6434692.1 sulfotransferase family 2 domain-containing protein [Pseudoalteromonas sp. MMG022]
MKKVGIVGTGKGAKELFQFLTKVNHNIEVSCFVDEPREVSELPATYYHIDEFLFEKPKLDILYLASERQMFNDIVHLHLNASYECRRYNWPMHNYLFDNKAKLIYKRCPKVMNSSVSSHFYTATYGQAPQFDPQTQRSLDLDRYFMESQSIWEMDSDLQQYFKFAIMRDPIKRFISAYNHIVLRSKRFKSNDINDFISNFAFYLGNYDIHDHFCPQNEYVGDNISFYNQLVDIKQVSTLEQKLGVTFAEHNVTKSVAPSLDGESTYEMLSEQSLNTLYAYYQRDYELYADIVGWDVRRT